jgi:hypothetical protein
MSQTQTIERRATNLNWLSATWAPALVTFVALGALLGVYFARGGDPRDFANIGIWFLQQGSFASPLIRYDPIYHGYPSNGIGYDGQFNYYFALDPLRAPPYIDWPAYRLSRPLYPLLARLLALGQPGLIPWTLLVINWLAIGGGVWALGALLRRRGWSAWWALLYAVFPGTLVALRSDLAEPLAYGLAALGIWAYERGGKRQWLWSGLSFALAVLARESAAIFPAALALTAALVALRAARSTGWRLASVAAALRRPTLWLLGIMTPYLVWKGILALWLGAVGLPSESFPTPLPFMGLAQRIPWTPTTWLAAIFFAAPALICFGLALYGLWRRADVAEFWALGATSLVYVLLLNTLSWSEIDSPARISLELAFALLWAAPTLGSLAGRARLWMVVTWGLWLAVAPLLVLSFFPSLASLLGSA